MTTWLEWSTAVAAGVCGVDDADLERAARIVRSVDVVLVAGNGGSASLASHMAQAIAKPAYGPGGGRAAVCLPDSVPTMTAHANDGGWESALVECAKPFVEPLSMATAVIIFSSSGKSRNVVKLAQFAEARGRPVIAFTGFDGGPLRELATVSLHVASMDYEVIEPVHDALLHRMQYHIRTLGAV